MTQFPYLIFSLFNLFLAHLHGNIQYIPYFWPIFSKLYRFYSIFVEIHHLKKKTYMCYAISLGGRGPDRTILINIRNRIEVPKSTSVPYIWFGRWKWYLHSYVRIEVSKSNSIPYEYDLESKNDNCIHIKIIFSLSYICRVWPSII